MSQPAVGLAERLLALLPWRLRSRNNFMTASANLLFAGVRQTPPARVPRHAAVEVHSLVCHRDLNMMLTSAKSFLRYLPEASLVLHDDGSISAPDRALLDRHLPGMRFISREHADATMRTLLPPDVYAKRSQHFFLLKLFDFNHFHEGERTILLDSDIVFLARPDEIVAWAADPDPAPFYNLDWCPSYRALRVPDGVSLPPRLNAGFMGYARRFSMEEIWRCCQAVDYWLEDQTIYALLLSGQGAGPLDPQRYRVYTGGEIDLTTPMVHFISPSRFKTLIYPRLAAKVFGALRSA